MDWESFRRAREPVAWILLIVAAISVVIGAWTLFGLPGGPFQNSGLPGHGGASLPFSLRAQDALTNFGSLYATVGPVIAVLLVTVIGGATQRAALVAVTAVVLLALALGLSLDSLLGTLKAGQSAWFYISEAQQVGLAAASLTLSVAILRSGALREAQSG